MPNFIAVLALLACSLPAAAAEVALIGLIGDKAAVLALDGGEPKTVKVGQSWKGITVVSVAKGSATVELEGKQRVLQIGQHYRNTAAVSASVRIATIPASEFFSLTRQSIRDTPRPNTARNKVA